MKRLGLYVIISAMMMVMVGGFASPEKVYAQAATLTHESAKQIVLPIFDQMIVNANTELQEDSALTSDAGKQRYADAQILIPKYITIVEQAKSAYVASYNTGLSPSAAQIQALNAAQTVLNNTTSGIPTIFPQILQKLAGFGAVINISRQQLTNAFTQATEVSNGNTAAPNLTNPAAAVNGSQALTDAKKESKCSIGSQTTIASCLDEIVSWLIKNTLLKVAGFLVWLAANILNFGVQIGILNFKTWAPDALYAVWVVVRQIVSLFIVFAGLYLGFMYIIGREKAFEKFFPWLIIFALFVNFSYPIARTFIDVTNIVALNIYSSTVGPEALTWDVSKVLYSDAASPGTIIMNNLGLQQLVASATSPDTAKADLVGSINSTAGALATVAFVFYAAYVFFMAAGIIIFRTAVLVFITIASPLLFVDSVIPILGDRAKQLRKLFFEQLVVAPVFMIMLALTMKFIEVFTVGPNAPMRPVVGLISNGGQMITAFFGVFMMLVMLHIALKVTRSISGSTGEMATNFMGKVGGFGMGVAAGGAGILARSSVGSLASQMRESNWMKSIQGSRTGRGLYSLTNSLANSTYDTRNIGVVGKGLTAAGMGTGFMGVGGGKGTSTTYETGFQARDKAMREKAASIKDENVRAKYLAQKTGGIGANFLANKFGIRTDAQRTKLKMDEDGQKQIDRYNKIKNPDRQLEFFESLSKDVQDRIRANGNAPGQPGAARAATGTGTQATGGTGTTTGTPGTGTTAGAGAGTTTGTNTGAANNTTGGTTNAGAPGTTAGPTPTAGTTTPGGTGTAAGSTPTANAAGANTAGAAANTASTPTGTPTINTASPAGAPVQLTPEEEIAQRRTERQTEAAKVARGEAPARDQADAGEFNAPPAQNQTPTATGNIQPPPQSAGFNASATDLIARRQERRAAEEAQAAIRRAQGGDGDTGTSGATAFNPPPASPSSNGASVIS